MADFLVKSLNEKWSEEMPVLYTWQIFIQDEFVEAFYEENGMPENKTVNFDFSDSGSAQACISAAQRGFRRQFDEE